MRASFRKTFMFIMASTWAIVLTGCSSAPTDDDLHAAATAQVQQISGKQGVEMFKADIQQMKLIGCKKADAGGYQCDWTGPRGAASGRLVKTDAGWVVIQP